jgi:hypothetical protein
MFRRERDARRTAKAVRDHKETMAAFGRASAGSRMLSNKEEINTHWRAIKPVETDAKDRYVNEGFKNQVIGSKLHGLLKAENAAERVGGGPVEPATWTSNSSLASGKPMNSVHTDKNPEFYQYPGKGKKDK